MADKPNASLEEVYRLVTTPTPFMIAPGEINEICESLHSAARREEAIANQSKSTFTIDMHRRSALRLHRLGRVLAAMRDGSSREDAERAADERP